MRNLIVQIYNFLFTSATIICSASGGFNSDSHFFAYTACASAAGVISTFCDILLVDLALQH